MSANPIEPTSPGPGRLQLESQSLELSQAHVVLTALERFRTSARPEKGRGPQLRGLRTIGRARKVSVSMPEDLTAAVRQRVGRGEFSHYVTEAVTRQLELDLLAELSALLEAEHGQVPEELLAEADAAWPDAE